MGDDQTEPRGLMPGKDAGSAAMIPDLPIWSAATLLIRQHGGDAESIAAQRADQMLNRGDLYGQQIWTRIKQAVAELQGRS